MIIVDKVEMEKRPKKEKSISDPDFFSNMRKGFSEAMVTGRFCDVKIICEDSNLWAHRVVLGTVSPFLGKLLREMEKRGDDVITIFLPKIKGYHMKLVLDYIYSGAMYLCGAHMQYVVQVMEVLNLKCGVSVNKMVQSASADEEWIEVEHSTVKIQTKFSTAPPNPGKLAKRMARKSSNDSSNNAQTDKKKILRRNSEEKTRIVNDVSINNKTPSNEGLANNDNDTMKKDTAAPSETTAPPETAKPSDTAAPTDTTAPSETDTSLDENEAVEIIDVPVSGEDDDFEKEKVDEANLNKDDTENVGSKKSLQADDNEESLNKEDASDNEEAVDAAYNKQAAEIEDADDNDQADDADNDQADDADNDQADNAHNDQAADIQNAANDNDFAADIEEAADIEQSDNIETANNEEAADIETVNNEETADMETANTEEAADIETINNDETADIVDGLEGSSDDSDDEPVMVEIDEDFAVDSLSSSQAEQNEGRKHKCALCGRMFRFFENLRVHLTGHLGVKVSLSRCHTCKRNFKNQTELDLHLKSHSYARHLGKYRLAKSAAEAAKTAAIADAKIITTVGTRDKKIIRKYMKNRSNVGVLTRHKEDGAGASAGASACAVSASASGDAEHKTSTSQKHQTKIKDIEKPKKSVPKLTLSLTVPRTPPTATMAAAASANIKTPSRLKNVSATSGQQFSCDICDKSFIVKSLYLRHMKHKHGVEPPVEREAITPLIVKKVGANKRHSISAIPSSSSTKAMASPSITTTSSTLLTSAKRSENPYSRQYSTPTSSRKREYSSSESSDMSSPMLPGAKRRKMLLDSSRSGSEGPPPTSHDPAVTTNPAKPSGSKVKDDLKCTDCDKLFVAKTILERHQYTAKHGVYGTSSDSGPGSPSIQHVTERQVDCHLCGQIFVRVKDLVKHREKVCTAWLNPGT